MNYWVCPACGTTVYSYGGSAQSHICTPHQWTVALGTSTILGTAAYPYTTSYPSPSPKPTPYWQKHKREPKWHLYANGQTLCDGFSESWVYNTNQTPTPEYVVSNDPPSHDKCEDCLAEYAALKLQDKVE